MFSIATGYGFEEEELGRKVGGVQADEGVEGEGDGNAVSAGGSNLQDSSRCRKEYHSVQKAGDVGL